MSDSSYQKLADTDSKNDNDSGKKEAGTKEVFIVETENGESSSSRVNSTRQSPLLKRPGSRVKKDSSNSISKMILTNGLKQNTAESPNSLDSNGGNGSVNLNVRGSGGNGSGGGDETNSVGSGSKSKAIEKSLSSYSLLGLDSYQDDEGNKHLIPMDSKPALREISKILDDFAKEHSEEPSFKERAILFYDTSKFGRVYELIEAILNFLFCVIYAINMDYRAYFNVTLKIDTDKIDLTLLTILIVLWIPHLLLVPNYRLILNNYTFLSSLFTLVPPLIGYLFIPGFAQDYLVKGYEAVIYFLPFRFFRLYFSLQTLLVPTQNPIFILSAIRRKALRLILNILFIFLTAASFFHVVEYVDPKKKPVTFFDAFWFTTVSSAWGLTTSINPDNIFSRFVILYVLALSIIFIPAMVSELLEMMRVQSKYVHSYKKKSDDQHVLVVGRFDHNSLSDFLSEFFCLDHGPSAINTKVIILHPDEPDERVSLLLNDPVYMNRVQYIKGTPISFRQLTKAKAESAEACFVISPKYAVQREGEDDAESVMRTLSIKRFNPSLSIHVQVLSPENKHHFGLLAGNLICIDEIRLGLLSNNCIAPGFSTLIHLMTTSINEINFKKLLKKLIRKDKTNWLIDYIDGATQEFYETRFSSHLRGFTFLQAAEAIYLKLKAVLVGIGIRKVSTATTWDDSLGYTLYLNPADYVIKGNEIAFVIAKDRYVAGQVEGINIELENLKQFQFEDLSPYFDPLNVSSNNTPNDNTEENAPLLAKNPSSNEAKKEQVAFPKQPKESVINIPDERLKKVTTIGKSKGKRKRKVKRRNSTVQGILNPISNAGTNVKNLIVEDINFFRDKFFREKEQADSRVSSIPESIRGHILLCDTGCKFPSNLDCFLEPVRGVHLDSKSAVVILSPCEPSPEDREYLQKFDQIYFIKGSPLDKKSLTRAGVERASKAVVLSNSTNYQNIKQRVADSTTLFSILNIEAMAPECYVVAEILHSENMKFLGDTEDLLRQNYNILDNEVILASPFISGHVTSPWMLDTLLCQSYYNPHLLNILKQLIFSGYKESMHAVSTSISSPSPPSTSASASTSNSVPLKTSFGHIFQVGIPFELMGCSYGTAVRYFVRYHKAICIGLYRSVPNRNGLYCVIPNPNESLSLDEDDYIYVICHRKPSFE